MAQMQFGAGTQSARLTMGDHLPSELTVALTAGALAGRGLPAGGGPAAGEGVAVGSASDIDARLGTCWHCSQARQKNRRHARESKSSLGGHMRFLLGDTATKAIAASDSRRPRRCHVGKRRMMGECGETRCAVPHTAKTGRMTAVIENRSEPGVRKTPSFQSLASSRTGLKPVGLTTSLVATSPDVGCGVKRQRNDRIGNTARQADQAQGSGNLDRVGNGQTVRLLLV